ncbi:hypothetical protein [[Kitasatospora] papulosa]|uniref:hypothetical protein n=1 Tax=[Kitasatospora] papulosa TaxID=1464011 RepID=UPI0036E95CF2
MSWGAVVGAVAVEGPEKVADCAVAADRLEAWVEEMNWWFELGRPHHQLRIVEEQQGRALEKVDDFLEQYRTALYQEPRWRPPHPVKRLRRQLGLGRTRKRMRFNGVSTKVPQTSIRGHEAGVLGCLARRRQPRTPGSSLRWGGVPLQ